MKMIESRMMNHLCMHIRIPGSEKAMKKTFRSMWRGLIRFVIFWKDW